MWTNKIKWWEWPLIPIGFAIFVAWHWIRESQNINVVECK